MSDISTPTHPLPHGVFRYRISCRSGGSTCCSYTIVASNMAHAWRKFLRQRFGILKPARKEYTITQEFP